MKVSNLRSLISKYAVDRKSVEVHARKLFGPRKAEETLAVVARLPNVQASATFIHGEKTKITVNVNRITTSNKSNTKPPRSFTPCFPKIKEEGWWCCAVNPDANEVLALKRVSFGSKGSFNLKIHDSVFLERLKQSNTTPIVHLISDSYLGLDVEIST
jgi:activating signal cointegrator complex subunit 3